MNQQSRVLIIDADSKSRGALQIRLENRQFQTVACITAKEAQSCLQSGQDWQVVIIDLMMEGIQGIELIRSFKQEHQQTQIIAVSAYPTVNLGVQAIKNGAYDFLIKPYDPEKLIHTIEKAVGEVNLQKENQILKHTYRPAVGFSDLIGQSPAMEAVRKAIRLCADSRANVLITGQSGTGKEVVAQCIHKNSRFHQGPFVPVNCGAIPANLIESELFGYEKGAFTGAERQVSGKFEQANHGTIFLDEIGELPLDAQVKLLRVLQQKEVTRVGGRETIPLNFRVIAATNRTLRQEVQQGRFREDLFYRLTLFIIDIPPLNERGRDTVLLARHFLKQFCELESQKPKQLDKDAEALIQKTNWSGNVRQLENCMHRTILMNPDLEIIGAEDLQMLPDNFQESIETGKTGETGGSLLKGKIKPFEWIEATVIQEALAITQGNIKETANQLNMARGTLYRKIKEYGLQ